MRQKNFNYSGLGSKLRKRPRDEESLMQMAYVLWLDRLIYNGLDIKYCASCGGMIKDAKTGSKMKKLGYRLGIPDIQIMEPRKGYHGFFVELKIKRGKVSKEQKEWQRALEVRGYKAIIMPMLEPQEGLAWLKKVTCQYLGVKS